MAQFAPALLAIVKLAIVMEPALFVILVSCLVAVTLAFLSVKLPIAILAMLLVNA